MKRNKIVVAIFVILIIAILSVIGLLVYNYIDSMQASNDNVENVEQNTQIENVVSSPISNEQVESEVILDPNLTPIENEPEEKESAVSTYYYSQLNETAKAIYDGLKENKSNLTSGNYIIDYGTDFNTILNTENGVEEVSQAFQSAWDAFSYDNMDLFYIDVTKITLTSQSYDLGGIKTYNISIGPGENNNYFSDSFKSKEEVESAMNYLENIKEQMIEQTATDDDYTKISKVHNWLIYFVNYEDNETSKDQHTIYGPLKNGEAVCEGYARAFKYLMDGVGIPCVLVSGNATTSQRRN